MTIVTIQLPTLLKSVKIRHTNTLTLVLRLWVNFSFKFSNFLTVTKFSNYKVIEVEQGSSPSTKNAEIHERTSVPYL